MVEESVQVCSTVTPQAEPDTAALIKRMQQQLTSLEKKVDILINRFQAVSPREKYFSKPYRSYEQASAEKGFGRGRRFEKHHGEENRGFGQKKKPFFHKRRDKG